MKKKFLIVSLFLVVNATLIVGFKFAPLLRQANVPIHKHEWSQWGDPESNENYSNLQYIQFRHCTNCGLSQFRLIEQEK